MLYLVCIVNIILLYFCVLSYMQVLIDRATSRADRAISNTAEKVADINPICLRFNIQNQVVQLKWYIDTLHLCG
jgi:hypothetical protein